MLKETEYLVAPEEAIKIAKETDIRFVDMIMNIEEEFQKTREGENDDFRWNYIITLHTIFIAGRVQGMREERSKNRMKISQNNIKGCQ